MVRTKKIWLRAIAGLAVVLGLALSVNAFDKKAEAEKVKEIIPELKVEKLAPIYKWYELVLTTNADSTFQTLASLSPMSNPPPPSDATNCAQTSLGPNFCAVVLEFPPLTSNFTLTNSNLKQAIDNHPVTISIATAADADNDGYSKRP